jgi:hypothetical protein
METTPAQAAKSEAAKQLVILLFAILTMISVMAITQPDFLRTLRMRVAAVSSRLLSSAARRAGLTSMEIELRTGLQKYELPFHLSRLRDTATRIYNEESDG